MAKAEANGNANMSTVAVRGELFGLMLPMLIGEDLHHRGALGDLASRACSPNAHPTLDHWASAFTKCHEPDAGSISHKRSNETGQQNV